MYLALKVSVQAYMYVYVYVCLPFPVSFVLAALHIIWRHVCMLLAHRYASAKDNVKRYLPASRMFCMERCGQKMCADDVL